MLQPLRCIKFGEILVDENRRMLLLCSQCHADYEQLHEFRQHLDFCLTGGGGGAPTQSIFADNASPLFTVNNESQHSLRKLTKGNQELHVFKYNGFKRLDIQAPEPSKTNTADDEFMDLIKIEEELLDPRWYTELGSTHIVEQSEANTSHQTATYNELVEAVTPFVQFKENLKSNESHTKVSQNLKQPKSIKNQILNGEKARITTTLTQQQPRDAANVKTNACIITRRLPTLAAKMTAQTIGSSRNCIKLLPVEQIQLSNKSSTLETYSGIQPKLPLETKQPQQKRCVVKLLLTNATTNAPTIDAHVPVMYQPNTLNGSSIKTEYQVNAIKEKHANEPTLVNQLYDASCSFSTTLQHPIQEISALPEKTIQTQQILNKLQTLGLQVKRKQPMNQPQLSASTTTLDPAKEKTLQLLKKLQSKGMNVKIVQTSKQGSNNSCVQQLEVPKRARLEVNNVDSEVTQKTPLNCNLIIRKLN